MRSILFPVLMVLALWSNASGTFSMVEINPLHGTEQNIFSDSSKHVYGAGEISCITELNGSLYFVAQDTTGNDELWTSDGTQQGTWKVKEINPNGSANITNIMKAGNKMLFMATDNNNSDYDLYSSDGTETGTIKVANVNQSSGEGLSADRAAPFGNKVLFCTSTALMSSDGTIAGTSAILNIAAYNASASSQGYCELNGIAYFILTSNLGQPQIWMTDGTNSGTQLALPLDSLAGVQKLMAFNHKLYVMASSNLGINLYSFDGNVNGVLTKIDIPGTTSYPYSVNVWGNQLLFTAYDSLGLHMHLYHMDTTQTAPELVPSVSSISTSGNSGLSFCNGAVYFVDENNQQIHSVNLGDLTHHSIDLVRYTMPQYFTTEYGFLVGNNGNVYFSAYDTATLKQVFMVSNGTTEGTFPMMPSGVNVDHPFNATLSCGIIDVFDFKMWENKVALPANFNNAGRELWIYDPDGIASGVPTVKSEMDVQIFPNPVLNELNFKTGNAGYCETNISVTDMKGQVVLRKTVSTETASIDVSSLAAGNYCISFASSSSPVTVKKFVVVK